MNDLKPRVFIAIAYYLPGHKSGGPVRSISNLCRHLQGGFDFFVFCNDRDFSDSSAYPNVDLNIWNQLDSCRVFYMAKGKSSFFPFLSMFLESKFEYY